MCSGSTTAAPKLDMQAHNGVRGLLALHVCVFHYLFGMGQWSPFHVNTQGNAHMPFFFLLSGFSLAVIYGDKISDKLTFYRNRVARVMPLFYLAHLFAAPLALIGWGVRPEDFRESVLRNLFATSTWGIYYKPEPAGPCGPSWTVCTLVAFYICFPFLVRFLKPIVVDASLIKSWGARLFVGIATMSGVAYAWYGYCGAPEKERDRFHPDSEDEMTKFYGIPLGLGLGLIAMGLGRRDGDAPATFLLTQLWWLQMAVGSAMFFGGLPAGIWADSDGTGKPVKGYWLATGWPVSRLPVFAMGIVGGLAVRQRLRDAQPGAGNRPWWGFKNRTPQDWAKHTDAAACAYLAVLFVYIVLDGIRLPSGPDLLLYTDNWIKYRLPAGVPIFGMSLSSGLWNQLATPFLQLSIIVGLTQDHRLSRCSKICLSRPAQFLGKISMPLYLFHMPVYSWALAAWRGPQWWFSPESVYGKTCRESLRPLTLECSQYFEIHQLPAWWLIPALTFLSIGVAVLLENCFECRD